VSWKPCSARYLLGIFSEYKGSMILFGVVTEADSCLRVYDLNQKTKNETNRSEKKYGKKEGDLVLGVEGVQHLL